MSETQSEEVNLAYIEACCDTYNNLDDERFCWILHHLGENINQLHHSIDTVFYLILGCFIVLFFRNK